VRREGSVDAPAAFHRGRRSDIGNARRGADARAAAAGTQAVNAFSVVAGELHAERIPLSDIAERFGTPCYVYSRAALEAGYRAFDAAFEGVPHLVCYAVKANSSLAVLNILARLGSGFDIVSGGTDTHLMLVDVFAKGLTGKVAEKALDKAGWKASDVDLYEINEAFAVVTMACVRDLGLEMARVNVNGGACALGHPIGATGARLVTTLVHALRKRGLKRGVASQCIGGGEATAIAIEIVG